MDSRKQLVFFNTLLIIRSTIAYTLSTSSVIATAGVSFSFTCTTNQSIIVFVKDDATYCLITGVENGTCQLDNSCSVNNIYDCNRTGTYEISIPGSFFTDRLHGSKWKCANPFGIGAPSNEVTLTFITYVLSTSAEIATVGLNFSFTCTTNQSFIVFIKDDVTYCLIEGVQNGKCQLDSSCSPNNTYDCKRTGTYEITIPGSFITDRLHRSKWKCANPFGFGAPSNEVELDYNMPLQGVSLSPKGTKTTKESDTIVFRCFARSFPVASLSWNLSESLLPTSTHLVITTDTVTSNFTYTAQKEDDGKTLSCSAIYESTSFTEEVVISVLYRPIVVISPNYGRYCVLENTTNLQLTCNVTGAKPAWTSITWKKEYHTISGDATYTIPLVNRSHAGSYTCNANNSVGMSEPSPAIQLEVLYGVDINPINKQTPIELNQLNISCDVQSLLEVTHTDVTWTKQNNATFRQKGRQLVIDNVHRKDSGTYVCSVVIKLSPTLGQSVNVTGTTILDVDVLYRPKVIVSPDKTPFNVIENTTNLQYTCNVTETNPTVTSYRWYKDGDMVSTAASYNISIVNRSHTGSYTCDATNSVGSSNQSLSVQLDVLYGVSLELSVTEMSINETDKWELSCIGDGNPVPKITCVYVNNRTAVGEQNANVTSIMVDHANCVDTGLYMCVGNNTIGEPVSQSSAIKVACKPRTYNELDKQDIIISVTDESLSISTKFISFPLSNTSWSRQLLDGNFTDLDSTFKISTIASHSPYETISLLQKSRLRSSEFGIYLVKAYNIHGSLILKYHVIPKRAPDSPTNVTASCDVTSIRVTWIAGFNGGENQTVCINFANYISNLTVFKDDISERGDDKPVSIVQESLRPDTLYIIVLEAYNIYGTTKSTEMANCTTKKDLEENQRVTSALVGGIAGLISALFIVVIVIGGLFCRRRRTFPDSLKDNPLYVTSGEVSNAEDGPAYSVVNKQKQNKENVHSDDKMDQGPVYAEVQKSGPHGKKRQTKKKTKDTSKKDNNTAIDIDGLKDNPVYVTTGEVSNAEEGPVYGVVNKPKQTKENVDSDDKKNQGPVHAEVQKSSTHENNKDIELGTIYENSDKLFKHTESEESHANAGEQDGAMKLPVPFTPKKNKDGLIYADVDFLSGPSGNRFVIRGQENRTNYAVIDLSKKAEPLPSDNGNEDKDSTNIN